MIKSFVYLLATFLFFNISEGICQIKFASRYLQEMYESLPSDCKFTASESSPYNRYSIKTNNIIKARYVTINYYLYDNTIEDIGVEVLDSTMKSLFPSEVLCRFVERKLLELLLIKNDNSLIEKLKEEKIDLFINQFPVLSCDMLQSAYEIVMDKNDFKLLRDSLRYNINWTNSINDEVTFSFPATNTLIRAKDKKELDDELYQQLRDFEYTWTMKEKFNLDDILINELDLNDNIYCTNGRVFYIPEINNNRYFKKDGEKLEYIFEPDYLVESLSNLVQYPLLNRKLNIQLKHRMYGYEEVFYMLRFSDLLGYFKNNCIFYTGIEQQTEDGIKAIIVLQNNLLNFIHLLVLDLNKTDLFEPDNFLSASFHTYIPTDNIQNLFEEYEPQKKQFKLKIK